MTVVSSKPSKSEPSAKTIRLSRARRNAILKALADPRRFELLERIAKAARPMGCAEVRKALAISPATLSHHVKELEAAGLVRVERTGKFIYLTLRSEVWEVFVGSLATFVPPHCPGR